MKKISFLLAIIMCVSGMFCLTSCGKKSEGENLGDVVVYSFYKAHFDDENNSTGRAAKRYEELYGGKVKEVNIPYSDYASTITNMIAANEAPDMVSVYGGDMPNWGVNILQPVDEYIEVSALSYQDIVEALSIDGKHYTLAVEQVQVPLIWYNKDLLDQFGIEKRPYDLWKEGNWTWDEFFKMAKQLTVDTNNDGKVDIYGFASEDPEILHYWNNDGLVSYDGTKATLNWKSVANIEAFTAMQKMINVDKSTSLTLESYDGTKFDNGQYAMAYGTFEYGWAHSTNLDISCIGVAPGPTGPSYNDKYTAMCNFFALPQGSKNPKGAAKLAELIAEEEKKNELGFDLGNQEALDILDEEAIEVIKYATEKASFHMERGYGDFVSIYMEAADRIYKNENITTVLDSLTPKAQAEIDDAFKVKQSKATE